MYICIYIYIYVYTYIYIALRFPSITVPFKAVRSEMGVQGVPYPPNTLSGGTRGDRTPPTGKPPKKIKSIRGYRGSHTPLREVGWASVYWRALGPFARTFWGELGYATLQPTPEPSHKNFSERF